MTATTLQANADSTALISRAGFERLCNELEVLRTEARSTLSAHLREARDDGDLEDNPTLQGLLEEKAQLEERIALLEARVRSAEIAKPRTDGRASIGTVVRVRDVTAGSKHEYELVGARESRVGSGRVSVEAPVGRALVGRLPGDRLEVETPRGAIGLEVLAVRPADEAPLEREAA